MPTASKHTETNSLISFPVAIALLAVVMRHAHDGLEEVIVSIHP
jgi:hypothetical protein